MDRYDDAEIKRELIVQFQFQKGEDWKDYCGIDPCNHDAAINIIERTRAMEKYKGCQFRVREITVITYPWV